VLRPGGRLSIFEPINRFLRQVLTRIRVSPGAAGEGVPVAAVDDITVDALLDSISPK
jgi:hypothetical protein